MNCRRRLVRHGESAKLFETRAGWTSSSSSATASMPVIDAFKEQGRQNLQDAQQHCRLLCTGKSRLCGGSTVSNPKLQSNEGWLGIGDIGCSIVDISLNERCLKLISRLWKSVETCEMQVVLEMNISSLLGGIVNSGFQLGRQWTIYFPHLRLSVGEDSYKTQLKRINLH